jgi:hypothetical protein
MKNDFVNFTLKCEQFNAQFLDNIKNIEDTKSYDEIIVDFKTQDNKLSEMFTTQNKGIQDIKPCLVSLEKVHEQNCNLLQPIEHLIDEVMLKKITSFHIILFIYFFIEPYINEYYI